MMGSQTSPHLAKKTTLTSTSTSTVTATSAAMAPSPLDLFLLTFNCAKNLINVGVFASHLYGALSQNATGTAGAALPDLVALSLQEVAPLSYSFIGSYFLNPYYARYEEALNLASARLLETKALESSDASDALPRPTPRPYTLVRAKNVGMTAILLFARDPTHIHKIEEAECGFGAADMGNKGAVGLRVTWSDAPNGATTPATEVTLVATHLAAMEWNLKKRNANWLTIVSGLTFANPLAILPGPFPPDTSAPRPDQSGAGDTRPPSSSSSSDETTHPLLPSPAPALSETDLAALQSASIFKPTSHLFVFGDLNYRISTSTPPPLAAFPSFDPSSPDYYPSFLPRDQLTQERLARRAFHGLAEAPVAFGPTYKFDVLPDSALDEADNVEAVRAGAQHNGVAEVPWRFAPHRWPGWCDRVLFLEEGVEVRGYEALPVVRTSDHRAVYLRAAVVPLGEEGAVSGRGEEDPRVKMPVAVDLHAWERRRAARQRELVVGWTAFWWSTKEGAVVMATVMVVVVGGWWLWGLGG
ncbi:Endonuclease/exonuclease/phosphatase [Podospora conica]|nr:Endonuclease/exonuclease/phosphatase [Schizothecium conicum]